MTWKAGSGVVGESVRWGDRLLMAAILGLSGYVLLQTSELLQRTTALTEQSVAVGRSVARLEAAVGGNISLREAKQDHEVLRDAIDHTWNVVQTLDGRVNKLENRR